MSYPTHDIGAAALQRLIAAVIERVPDALLTPNRVGNLSIRSASDEYIGYINFGSETVKWNADDAAEDEQAT